MECSLGVSPSTDAAIHATLTGNRNKWEGAGDSRKPNKLGVKIIILMLKKYCYEP